MGQTETGWLRPALALVAAITLLRWLLLAFDHTDLYVDESQYWLWGQEFAFGYYSKPPLIGWMIGAVTSLTNDSIFWVRMPGAALHGVTALVLAALAARLYGRRAAVLTAAAYATLPFTALGSLLISTDTVMAPFFAAALYFHQRLLETRAARFALLAGAMGGMAFMAKYIALFFLAGVALAALRKEGRIGWRNAALLGFAFAAVISPNIWWNLTHKMTTFSHTVDNIGWVREDNPLASLRPLATLQFVLEQFGVFGPVLLAALLITLRRLPVQAAFAAPVLLVITLQSVLGRAESNWTVSAYFAGTVLAIGLLRQHPRAELWASYDTRRATGRAAQQRTDARQQFVDVVGLEHVIVGPGVQPCNALADLVACGDDDHQRGVLARAQGAQHVQSVAFGQAQVEQHQVVGLAAQGAVGHVAVFHPVHRKVLGAQHVEHGLADHRVVFYKQQAHGWQDRQKRDGAALSLGQA